jgi:hypothetical protein
MGTTGYGSIEKRRGKNDQQMGKPGKYPLPAEDLESGMPPAVDHGD